MSKTYLIRMVFLLAICFMSLLIYVYLRISKRQKEKEEREKIVGARKKKNANLFKAYKFFAEFKLTRTFLKKWVKVYSLRIPGDYRRVREEAMKTSLFMWAISAGLLTWALLFDLTLYGLSCAGLGAYFICKTYTIAKMEKLDLQIIKELNLFVDDVRHYYFDTKMVEESIKESLKDSPLLLMKQHGQKIYEVVIADNVLDAARKYNKTINDYYLRKFMATCVVVTQYGDRTIDDESLFLSSLRDIKQDIQIELIRRRGISSKFKSLSFIAMCPYFLCHVIEEFGSGMFASVADLYRGTFGSLSKVFLFFATFILYQVVNKLRETIQIENENPKFLKWLYGKQVVREIVKAKLNKNWGKTLRLRTFLKKTGNPLNVYQFTLKRMCYFVTAFVVGIIFLIGMHINNKAMHTENILGALSTTSGASDEETFEMLIMADRYLELYKDVDFRKMYNESSGLPATMYFDKEVSAFATNYLVNVMQTQSAGVEEAKAWLQIDPFLEEFDGTTYSIVSLKGKNYEDVASGNDAFSVAAYHQFQNSVRKANEINFFEKKPEYYTLIANAVVKKIKKYQNEYFRWYDFLLALLAAVIAYWEPYLILIFEKRSLQMDMMDEVIQYESVIMILMYIERMTVEEILNWMYMFSRIFHNSLSTAICMYTLDEVDALDQLITDEPYEPFRRLIENLKVCDRIGVEMAFNGLKSERKNYQEERKQENEISLATKAATGSFLAFLPCYLVIGLYMIVPYCIAAVGDMIASMSEVNSAAQAAQ